MQHSLEHSFEGNGASGHVTHVLLGQRSIAWSIAWIIAESIAWSIALSIAWRTALSIP